MQSYCRHSCRLHLLYPCQCVLGNNTLDVWYKFVATAAIQKIELICSSNFYGVEELMASCTGPSLGCIGSGPGLDDTLNATGLTIGNTYYIRVYDYWNPSPTQTFSICVFNTVTGIADNATPEAAIVISPNPSSGQFSIEGIDGTGEIEIYNTLGEKVYAELVSASSITVDISLQPAGIYFYKIISDDNKVTTGKLIIQ